jgi:hypothetical protein
MGHLGDLVDPLALQDQAVEVVVVTLSVADGGNADRLVLGHLQVS